MLTQEILFYVFSFVLVAASFLVILARNPVYSILFLVLAFFVSAALWLMLEAEFLALVLVLVYVGAVMTLFLFVVMMLDLDIAPKSAKFVRYLPFGILIVGFIVAGILYVIGPAHFALANMPSPPGEPASYNNVAALGDVLYTHYVYPFEIAAVLLLVAIIAAISLSLRKPRAKTQNIPEQLRAERKHRVRLVKMKSEKPK